MAKGENGEGWESVAGKGKCEAGTKGWRVSSRGRGGRR